MRDFNSSLFESIRNIAVMAFVLWCLARVILFSRIDLLIHNYSIGSIPAHDFLDRIADFALPHDGKGVMFIGPSTVREGFDDALISKLAGLHCVNCGVTSQGSIYHTEMQLDIISNYGIRPNVLILGLNSRMLSLRPNPIGINRYVDYLDNGQLKVLISRENKNSVKYTEFEHIKSALWPGYHFALRLDYLARYVLMKVNQFLGNWNHLESKDFSRGVDPVLHLPKYLYSEQEFSEKAFRFQLEGSRKLGLLNPHRYGTLDDIIAFHRVIEKSIQIAKNVLVIVMPEHCRIRNSLGSWGDYAFYKVLREYNPKQIEVIDLRSSMPDNLIRDFAHLVPQGRRQFSELVSNHLIERKQQLVE